MDLKAVAPTVGVGACVALLVALGVPYVAITDAGGTLGAYYASGPVGSGGIAFMALLTIVVFLSGTRGTAEPDLVAGITVVLGIATLALAVVWAISIDPTVLFSFPPSAAWIANHRWVVVAVAALVPASAAAYARGVLWG